MFLKEYSLTSAHYTNHQKLLQIITIAQTTTPPKMIKVPQQIMTSNDKITNERPAKILLLVNYSVYWSLIGYSIE